jgi:hypothetical protein
MGAHKPDVNISHYKLDDDNQPVLVALNIENIVLVTHVVRGGKVDFYIRQISPFGL